MTRQDITVHIEHLILDDVPLAPGHRDRLGARIQQEFVQSLVDGTLEADAPPALLERGIVAAVGRAVRPPDEGRSSPSGIRKASR